MTDAFDAVVLAGGASSRLAGIVPSHHKPLLVVNGQSLLLRNVRLALDAGAQRVIVVSCPEIAQPTCDILRHASKDPWSIRIMIRTGGPGVAARDGIDLCTANRVLLLMADNWNATHDLQRVVQSRYAVGVKIVPALEANRFTRLINDRWVEGGEQLTGTGPTIVWCGPLIVSREHAARHLGNGDSLIGPHLNDLVPEHSYLTPVPVNSHDLGTPESITQFTSNLS